MFRTSLIPSFLFVSMLWLGGCASVNRPDADDPEVEAERQSQLQEALQAQLQYQQRLDNLAIPFQEKNVAWCGSDITGSLGVRVGSVWSYPKEQRDAAHNALGLDNQPKVLWRIRGSAAQSDLQPGDYLISVDGQPLKRNKQGLKRLDSILSNRPDFFRIQVLRNGQQLTITARPSQRCDYAPVAELNGTVNAYTDGSKIVVYSGMMNLFPDDRDLAVIFGHELAHDVRSHTSKGYASNMLGAVVDSYLGGLGLFDEYISTPFLRRFEAEADYTGLYMTANAGYDISGAERVWRKMGINSLSTVDKGLKDTHPSSPERFVAIRRTVREIQAKQKAGQVLRPE